MKKYLFFLLIGILILGCNRDTEVKEQQEKAREENANPNILQLDAARQKNIDLKIEQVKEGEVQETIRLMGKVEPDQTRTALIRPLTFGRILTVHARQGDRVRTGSELLTYDNIELGDLVAQYREVATEVEVAKNSLDRAKKLVDLGAISRAEFERRNAEHKNSIARAESIRTKLQRFGVNPEKASKTMPSRTVLRSPFSGVITMLDAAEGESIGPEDEVLAVTDLSRVWVTGNLFEKDLSGVRVGQQAQINADAYPEDVFSGMITYIGDVVDPNTRTIPLRCEVANPDGRLKLGLFVTMEVPITSQHKALTIPSSAIQQFGDELAVFVKKGDHEFEKRTVHIAGRSGDAVEVTAGVRTGDLIVTQGSFQLKSEIKKEEIETEEE